MPLPRLLLLLALLGSAALGAQGLDYGQGQLIVQLRGEVDGKAWARAHKELSAWKPLSRGLNTYLVAFDWAKYAEKQLRSDFAADDRVVNVQLNHRLSLRRRPNDPRYPQQWQFFNTGQIGGENGADYNVQPAWDVTTGGVTVNGDTIVIASIDNGIDLDHEDLMANIWVNRDEIPGNGRDDDRNGYIDDRFGWNTALDNNDVEGGKGDHGTPVMGQIAAVGNNGLGVTGVNWTARVMNITNDFDPLESEVIEAYGYALEARKRYDASGGREGAYVVATNASWGRDRAFPSQSPIWCSLYDTLGKYGIINVAAVPNRDIDVDEVGDLPSLCESEYLVVVTSIDTRNKKVKDAAGGSISVDLAAFGEGVYTTLLGNSYGAVYGTSFAAPAVTGAFGLLYSAPCPSLGQLLRSDPAAAARYLRDVLYGSLRPLPTLAGTTVTGGSLNVGAAMTTLMQGCADCLAPTSFTASPPGDASSDLLLSWKVSAAVDRVDLQYRPTGSTEWTTVAGVGSPYRLTGLPSCREYDLQLVSRCGGTTSGTEIRSVETPGCCRLPDDYRVKALAGGRIVAEWEPLLNALSYTLRYRTGDDEWTEITTPEARLELTGLRNCRTYEIELRTNCTGGVTRFQGRRIQKTLGCGVCLDADYCLPTGFGNEQEWIARVEIPGILDVASSREIDGYRNFGDETLSSMVPGGVYPITLTPAYRGSGFTQDFHVYIDWNQDAVFTPDELVVEQTAPRGGVARGVIEVPEVSELGLTRMRVIMQFTTVKTGPCPAGTNQQFSGEIEDYCIDVTPVQGCPPPDGLTATYEDQPQQTTLSWGASAAPGGSYHLRYRPRSGDVSYTERTVKGLSATVANVNLCSSYEVQIASICDGVPGEYRVTFFGDDCVSNPDASLPETRWSLYPNPASGWTRLAWAGELTVASVSLYTVDGRRALEWSVDPAARELELRLDGLPPGVYVLRLFTVDGRSGSRRLLLR
ncbi:S8 family serine peptidase [Neolewinella litorea]|uniref:T9SS type A sorting domain-containing protein n=1 Tax=Neolewinella litorea TaxID=2562452 RepID=A0A4S4NI96_9BACT|nr:S8 family serine peptidase [Neolewinella litorea]THH39442.1 T9SS type A sorting domain-containing protein [Neolewinella litorea]